MTPETKREEDGLTLVSPEGTVVDPSGWMEVWFQAGKVTSTVKLWYTALAKRKSPAAYSPGVSNREARQTR